MVAQIKRIGALLFSAMLLIILLPMKVSAATYRNGSSGSAVYTLQQNLEGLGYGCVPDGIFGSKTERAVRWYQSDKGLTADGIAGSRTNAALKEDVQILQQRLNALGYAAGTADGIYGSATRSAVLAFQKAEGLSVDGVAGSKTRLALQNASDNTEYQNGITVSSSLSDFQQYAKANWAAPLRVSYLPVTGGRAFGYLRSDGRRHAAIDFYVNNGAGTPVYAMSAGTVTGISTTFYYGTGAVTITNTDGSVLRYGEITPAVKNGAAVAKGQIIGYIAKNEYDGGTMLHLELYRGNASGSLSQTNSQYWYVSGNYNRRADLLDPTFLIQ